VSNIKTRSALGNGDTNFINKQIKLTKEINAKLDKNSIDFKNNQKLIDAYENSFKANKN